MMGDRPAPLEAMVELRQNRMIQPCPPSTTSTGSSIPSPTTPPWREAVQVHPLGQERPDRFTEFVQLTQKKNRLVNERLEPTQTETNQGLNRMDG